MTARSPPTWPQSTRKSWRSSNCGFAKAAEYNGLPLDDRSALEQILAERPSGTPERDRYIYYPDCASRAGELRCGHRRAHPFDSRRSEDRLG